MTGRKIAEEGWHIADGMPPAGRRVKCVAFCGASSRAIAGAHTL